MDEPTTGLDPHARRKLWEVIESLKSKGTSILLTTHYMEEAEALADQVAIIDEGKIIAQGSPKQLISDTCGEQILWVQFDSDDDPVAIKAVISQKLSWFENASEQEGGFELVTENAASLINDLSTAISPLGYSIKNLQMRNCTLEDVFLKLTGKRISGE